MTKMKITRCRVIGGGCTHLQILPESVSQLVSQSISQSVLYQVLNAISDSLLKRKCLMKKNFLANVPVSLSPTN